MQAPERRADKNKSKREPWQDPHAEGYVRIENITKKFGDFTAVNNVSLKIYQGEIFCLLGGSGCGKSTLLRMMAGFEYPTAGSIYLDGQDMATVPPYERPVNMMFQSYALFPHMTVAANIGFGLEQERLPAPEIAGRVAEILEIVRLGDYGRRKPHQLSGGQRQRVALARALVKRPKLLLLDEPLGALDRKLREHTQFELIGIQEKLGVTFIVVTHDQEEAMTLASRVGVMNRGEIVQVGTPRDIYEFPATRFVADFIGSVNLFEGRLAEDEPGFARVQCPELPVPVLIDHGVSAPPAADCWVAVRPEKIDIAREQPLARDNWAHGLIHDIAYMGDMSIYVVRLDSGRDVRVTLANRTRKPEEQYTWGDAVYLHWDASSPVTGMG
jgi:putrescine transport system ATP-binding protein